MLLASVLPACRGLNVLGLCMLASRGLNVLGLCMLASRGLNVLGLCIAAPLWSEFYWPLYWISDEDAVLWCQ